jgi:hypothetical protein
MPSMASLQQLGACQWHFNTPTLAAAQRALKEGFPALPFSGSLAIPCCYCASPLPPRARANAQPNPLPWDIPSKAMATQAAHTRMRAAVGLALLPMLSLACPRSAKLLCEVFVPPHATVRSLRPLQASVS